PRHGRLPPRDPPAEGDRARPFRGLPPARPGDGMTMAQAADDDTLLRVKGLTKHFTLHGDIYSRLAGEKAQVLKAVDGIDFHIGRGETLGLVGERRCGKSTTARLVTRLIEPTGGEVSLKGEDMLAFSRGRMKEARKEVQLVFQDPYSSL